jgi:gluconolactonase
MPESILDIRDDRFLAVVESDAALDVVAEGFQFLEGPIWHPHDHCLIFSDIIGDSLYRWQASQGISIFRRPSHMANGNTFDHQGRILTCEHATSRVTRTDPKGDIDVLVSHYQGKELNSPNDIIVRSDGRIYFTDPNSGRNEPYGVARPQELDFQGVYCLDPESGTLTLIADDFEKPNGLCFNLDESLLFINDTVRQHIRVFDVSADGMLDKGRLWAELWEDGVGVADGMKMDTAGRLFCTGPGGVYVFDQKAALLGRILVPQQAANFTWGDADLCSLYITASQTLYRIRLKHAGPSLF